MGNNKQSKRFLIFVLILSPCFSLLIFGASYVWDLPSAKSIMGICAFTSLCVGLILRKVLLRILGVVYDGQLIIVTDQDNQKIFRLTLDRTLEELEQQRSITFVINRDKERIIEES